MKFPDVKIMTFQNASDDGVFTVTAQGSLPLLMDTYATMEFRSFISEKMAQKFVEDHYERLTTGINFEDIEKAVLDLVKQKFADLLKLEPKKPEPVLVRSRDGYIRVRHIDGTGPR